MDWWISVGGLHDIANLFIAFHKLEMSDDLKYHISQIGSFVFLVFLDSEYQSGVVDSNIH